MILRTSKNKIRKYIILIIFINYLYIIYLYLNQLFYLFCYNIKQTNIFVILLHYKPLRYIMPNEINIFSTRTCNRRRNFQPLQKKSMLLHKISNLFLKGGSESKAGQIKIRIHVLLLKNIFIFYYLI